MSCNIYLYLRLTDALYGYSLRIPIGQPRYLRACIRPVGWAGAPYESIFTALNINKQQKGAVVGLVGWRVAGG